MAPKDYNLLACAVRCPACDAPPGDRCAGARPGTRTVGTHFKRRALAAKVRKEAARARLAG